MQALEVRGHEIDESRDQVFEVRVRHVGRVRYVMHDPKTCPRCGEHGYGSYKHWAKAPKYIYSYYAHPNGIRNGREWCYLGKRVGVIEHSDDEVIETEEPRQFFIAVQSISEERKQEILADLKQRGII